MPGPSQCLPFPWVDGDATISLLAAINWRPIEFFSELIADFIPPFQRVPHEPCINEHGLISQAAMVLEWDGSSISEELIHGMGNMRALSCVSLGHSSHGSASRIKIGAYFRVGILRICAPPFNFDMGAIFRSISRPALLIPSYKSCMELNVRNGSNSAGNGGNF